ncbi:MAG: BcpO-related WXXGXW repeat protein, partial [Thermogutta sp.]|nr:BcpO-related WXXGXW repeat protein [Thermogutta sp.]
MNVRHVGKWCVVGTLLALSLNASNKAASAQPVPVDTEEGVQVLTRGPVHEAFAETVTFDPEPGILVPKEPPAAIEELPPDQRPEGDNVTWIPGYWAWDDERSDFLWVSGIWRALPPGRQWVPGYWSRSSQGYQWTSGYWADVEASEVEYLPEPPASVEVGPNIAASSADQTWLPGCWIWQQSRYAWRPGFWATVEPDWVWVPAHYVWAPRGYVFVDGYWDYSIGRRGMLFAPVYFKSNVYAQRGFSYSPKTVIDLGVFVNHLFLRPQYRHYYFGDYYAANYQTAGFYPSHSYNSGRYGYDPIYAHQRWRHRQDGQWEHRVAADFQNRRDHEDARPLRTWAAQRALGTSEARARERGLVVAAPLSQFTRSPNSPLRFQPVDQLERQKLGQHGQEVQRFREERRRLETPAAATSAVPRSKDFAPARVPLPRSPVVSRPVRELGQGHAPPRKHEASKPDPTVEPKPRAARSQQPQQHGMSRLPPDTAQPKPQPHPRIERPAPQAQPRVERPAPRRGPEPKADRPAP